MLQLRLFEKSFLVGLMILGAGVASGQNYPSRPIRIVTTVTGGSLDRTSRLMAPKLAEYLGQKVIIDNRGGVVSMELVAKATADGYTLLIASGSLWISEFLRDNVAWDALRDYAPVSLLVTSPNIIVVHPSLPVRSVKDLIALAKARPGEIDYSSGQTGSSSHLAGEFFKRIAGVNIVRVPYRGGGPAMVAVITGEAQISFPNAASAMPYIKAGRIKGLAVTTTKPSALAPGMPTAESSGLPGYESKAMVGIFAPANTSGPIIQQLNREIVRVLHDAGIKRRLFNSGLEVVASSPAEATAMIKSDMATTGKLIKDIGIRAN